MGAVYQAKDMKRQTICAIKEMSLSMVSAEERPQAIENFKVEAKILWGLSHANLPTFTGFFQEGQRYFLVMEYIDGLTLEQLLERNGGPFPERRVLGWARQLCDVLEYLHSQNPPIIFRDMKPGNVMLMRNGRVKLIDFGIARFFRPAIAQDTQQLGTPGFAPPEQYGKTQTDERSDIYSLAITLFHLLTNTLSERGFGLRDVRAVNPEISLSVARALEKATALQPEERYENVAAFRRALLGEGTFVFEDGDAATTPEELAELSARYPEEAADYLAAGELEAWLREIGEVDLARTTRQLRTAVEDPLEGVEQLVQVILSSRMKMRHHYHVSSSRRENAVDAVAAGKSGAASLRRGWSEHKARSPLQVSPQQLDFGRVYPGVSTPLPLTIREEQGTLVSGTIQANEPWILLDQARFESVSTRVHVRVNSIGLRGATHYTGSIAISVDGEESAQDIIVPVEVEVASYSAANGHRRGKTIGADLDDDEDEEETEQNGAMSMAEASRDALDSSSLLAARREEYTAKYGQPSADGKSESAWNPLQTTERQHQWVQRCLTFFAAFMLASLCYTVVSQLPPLLSAPPLPPSPWFIVVLAGSIPAATLGALLANWNVSSSVRDLVNCACTGMGSALLSLTLLQGLWLLLLHVHLPLLELVAMLLSSAGGAAVGTNLFISDYMIYGVSWTLIHMRVPIIITAALLGGSLGFFLTLTFALSCFSLFGALFGAAVALALVMRVDQLMKQQH